MGAGTLTAGVVAGGATGTYPFTAQSTSFEYDGTNWTSGGTMNKGRWIGASGGPQTAALFLEDLIQLVVQIQQIQNHMMEHHLLLCLHYQQQFHKTWVVEIHHLQSLMVEVIHQQLQLLLLGMDPLGLHHQQL